MRVCVCVCLRVSVHVHECVCVLKKMGMKGQACISEIAEDKLDSRYRGVCR